MQAELDIKTPAPEVTPEEVDALVEFLSGKGWITARQIAAATGIDDRRLRAIVEHCGARILSGPGCPGYRYYDKDALPHAEHAIACLESQAAKMLKRALAYRHRYHRFVKDHFRTFAEPH